MPATTNILVGDARTRLAELDAGSVQTCITSPPYFGLRSYLPDGHDDKHKEIGLESTVEAYVAELVAVFRDVRRVLRDDGTLWLNLGDSYNTNGPGPNGHGLQTAYPTYAKGTGRGRVDNLKPKDLIGIPWRVALALQADGWYLRSDIIWHKPNPMPESVRDRPTKSHEYLFLLAKSERYYYDAEAVKEPPSATSHGGNGELARTANGGGMASRAAGVHHAGLSLSLGQKASPAGRNRRSVWTIATRPFKGAHFAVFPPALVEPCVLAGTSERGQCPACGAPWLRIVERSFTNGHVRFDVEVKSRNIGQQQIRNGRAYESGNGTAFPTVAVRDLGWQPSCQCDAGDPVPQVVLDPFGGSGTTALVANEHGRKAILVELNPEYADLARDRLADHASKLAKARGNGQLTFEDAA